MFLSGERVVKQRHLVPEYYGVDNNCVVTMFPAIFVYGTSKIH